MDYFAGKARFTCENIPVLKSTPCCITLWLAFRGSFQRDLPSRITYSTKAEKPEEEDDEEEEGEEEGEEEEARGMCYLLLDHH